MAQKGMLSEPKINSYAITKEEEKKLEKKYMIDKDFADVNEYYIIEVWCYSPEILGSKQTIDILSLYASLKDKEDARIEIELENLLEGVLNERN